MPPASAAVTAVAKTFFRIDGRCCFGAVNSHGFDSFPLHNYRVSLDVVKFSRASTAVLAGGGDNTHR